MITVALLSFVFLGIARDRPSRINSFSPNAKSEVCARPPAVKGRKIQMDHPRSAQIYRNELTLDFKISNFKISILTIFFTNFHMFFFFSRFLTFSQIFTFFPLFQNFNNFSIFRTFPITTIFYRFLPFLQVSQISQKTNIFRVLKIFRFFYDIQKS